MKRFIKEIEKGVNLESSLPQYGSYLMDLYHRKAAVELAMDYYTYQGIIADNVTKDDYIDDFTKQFNELVKEYVILIPVNEKREEGICKIDRLRNKVYNVVEILSAYADIFSRYEYVINRCEYLFKEEKASGKYTDEDFTREIMNYIFSDKDNAVINTKICEIISELPLRMTKNKFFELLSNGMSVYAKTDKVTIDDFIYAIRSSALLELPEGMEYYESLKDIYEDISKTDYQAIKKEQFDKVVDELTYSADFIEKVTNIFMMLQGLINKAYAMLLAVPYVNIHQKDIENAINIIAKINENFYNENYLTLEEDITDRFVFMEGTPEELGNMIQSVEYTLDHVRENHMADVKNITAEKMYQGLFFCERLLSDSLFIDLTKEAALFEERMQDDGEPEDIGEYLEQKKNELIDELTEFFRTHQKLLGRSVMSMILSKLPVYFNNVTELQDYVYHSLSSCTNKTEKTACIELIKSIMEN